MSLFHGVHRIAISNMLRIALTTYVVLNYDILLLQGAGWKIVASFEGNFPNRIKQLPLDRHFDINNVKRVCIPCMDSM